MGKKRGTRGKGNQGSPVAPSKIDEPSIQGGTPGVLEDRKPPDPSPTPTNVGEPAPTDPPNTEPGPDDESKHESTLFDSSSDTGKQSTLEGNVEPEEVEKSSKLPSESPSHSSEEEMSKLEHDDMDHRQDGIP